MNDSPVPGDQALQGDVHRLARNAVIRQALSISLATALYGVSYGALAITAGLGAWQTMVLSLVMYSGASQFAFIGVAGAGGSAVSAIATSGLLGVRNGLYGIQLGPLLAYRGWKRVAAGHFTTDESNAVATGQRDPRLQRIGFWTAGFGVFSGWNICTYLGILLGNAIGNPTRWGLDAAASAAFLALLWPRLASRNAQACAALAVVIAAVLIPFTPNGVPVLCAALAAVIAGLWDARKAQGEKPNAASGELLGGTATGALAAEPHLKGATSESTIPEGGGGDI